jgi:RNA-directed DNA polymerase
MWLQAPVVEPPEKKGGPSKWSRPTQGTPQGGVISPLLANVYLHWFDKAFHETGGPAQWGKAKLVRYADDLVVLARHQSRGLIGFIEKRLESGLGLENNREKTRVVDLKEEGASLDFLGYTFRYDRDLQGRDQKYLNMFPSEKALKRERAKLHDMTASRHCFKPIPQLIGEMNRHLKGWANYFSIGHPRVALREINTYVRDRLVQHLRRRSQRPFRPPEGVTYYEQLQRMGLIYL